MRDAISKLCWPVVALSFFFVASSAVWLYLNHAPPQWDDSWYLTGSLNMYDALADGGLPSYASRYLTMLRSKPPLITVLPTPIYLVFGRQPRAAYFVNLAAMPVLFLTLYAIGRKCGSKITGYVAVFVAGTMPLLYGLSHWFLVEYWLTALVCLTIYLVMEGIERPGFGIFVLLGVTCGLGALLKITFPLYAILPIFYLLHRVSRGSRRVLVSLAALLAPALLLALPWYAVNYRHAIGRAVFSGFSNEVQTAYGTGAVFSLSSVKLYLLNLVNFTASPYYVLLAGAILALLCFTGKIQLWFSTEPKSHRVVFILWALPFLVFLFGRNKDLRFVAPILPLLALLIASTLDRALSLSAGWKFATITLLLLFPLLAFLHTSFGVFDDFRLAAGDLIFTARQLHFAAVYDRQGWPHRQILERMIRASKIPQGEKLAVMIGTDVPEFNVNNFELAVVQDRLPLVVTTSAYEKDLPTLLSQLHSTSFFLYKDGGEQEPEGFYNRHRKALIQQVHESGFNEIPCDLRLPDGGVPKIFENTSRSANVREAVLIRAGMNQVDPYAFDFGGQIRLTGFTLTQTEKSLDVRLRWRCTRAPDREYRSFVHILDRAGSVVGQLDHALVGGTPSVLTWRPNDVALERLDFDLPGNLKAGSYHFRFGIFDPVTGERLTVKLLSGGKQFAVTDQGTAVLTPEATSQKP
jgi:4-amino-4-deoxy-L-arabinose transferase-like glycosyltransferase